MDILGFFDGLFSAFSAARSDKKIDDERDKKERLAKQKSTHENTANAQSDKERIQKAREQKTKNAEYDKDMR
ncbi:hypothetical protein ACPUVO_05485 [Pseudocolwellia sp. HL-MZ19]|uniref:hypothetical protein n=1 Tax=Pseudocolwellia sp. HL-MZ19 TaxID=3400846 RepID=UPI003CF2D267